MVLFVCSQGQLRSRTAELLCLFGGQDARCCGTDESSPYPVNDRMLAQASLVVCMENEHKKALKDFCHYSEKEVVVLGIKDVYNRLDPMLMQSLVYQMGFHNQGVADVMDKGRAVLDGLPDYAKTLV